MRNKTCQLVITAGSRNAIFMIRILERAIQMCCFLSSINPTQGDNTTKTQGIIGYERECEVFKRNAKPNP